MDPSLKLFYKFGSFNSKHAWKILIFELILVVLCSIGLAFLHVESHPHKLWIDTDSQDHNNRMYFEDEFGRSLRINRAIFTAKDESVDDIFQKDYLTELWSVQGEIESFEFLHKNSLYRLEYYCNKPIDNKSCHTTSSMDYWKMNINYLDIDNNIKQTANCLSLTNQDISCYDRLGLPVYQNAVFGGISNTGGILTAKALILTFYLNDDDQTRDDGVETWEKRAFGEKLKDFNENSKNKLKVTYRSERSMSDQLKNHEYINPLLIIIPLIILLIFFGLIFGNYTKIHSRWTLSLGAVMTLISTGIITFGLSPLFSIQVNVITLQVIPFLIIILGGNHLCFIFWAYKKAKKNISETVKRCGALLTSIFLAEIAVFIIGSTFKYQVVHDFCVNMIVAVISLYILHLTGFVCMLELDNRRITQKRLDIVFCYDVLSITKEKSNHLAQKLIKNFYLPALYHIITQISVAIIAIFMILLSFGSLDHFSRGLTPQILTKSGSHLHNYYEDYAKYLEIGEIGWVVLKDMNYTNAYNFELIRKLSDSLSNMKHSVDSPVYAWINPFSTYISVKDKDCNNTEIDSWDFGTKVRNFLDIQYESVCCKKLGVCGELYKDDIVFTTTDLLQIKSSRLKFYFKHLTSQHDYIEAHRETEYASNKYATDFVPNLNPGYNAFKSQDDGYIDWISSKDTLKNTRKLAFSYSDFMEYYQQYDEIRGKIIEKYFIVLATIMLVFEIFYGIFTGFLISILVAIAS